MDWKKEAIEDLRAYEAKKLSLINMPDKLEALKERSLAVKGGMGDSVPTPGGTSTAEDKLLSNIVERDKLGYNLSATQREVAIVERALATLTDTERLVLEKFYISRPRNHVEVLCEMLNYEVPNIYRIKEKALEEFTRAMYGMLNTR